MLMMACTAIQAVMPPASSWLNRSAARREMLTPRYEDDEEEPDDADDADQTQAPRRCTAKMKSVWDSGR